MIIATKAIVTHRERRGWPFNGQLNIPAESDKETAYSTAWDAVEIAAQNIDLEEAQKIIHNSNMTKKQAKIVSKRRFSVGRRPKPGEVNPKKYDEAYNKKLKYSAKKYMVKELGHE